MKQFFCFLCAAALLFSACESPSNSDPVKNSDAAVLSFTIGETVGAISGTDIALWLPAETGKTGLSPAITLSRGATVSPASGSPQDFSDPVAYVVTAEDGSVQNYTVRVSSDDALQPPPFDSVEALAAYLADFEGQNNRENPVKVVFSAAVDLADFKAPAHNGAGEDPLGALFDALNGKYARLDLSACTGAVLEDTQSGISWVRNNRGSLTGIVLPEELTTLGAYMLYGCYSLEECVAPPSLTGIGQYAFSGCDSLVNLDLEAALGLTTLGDYVFAEWPGLSRIILPSTLTTIGNSAFRNCAGLTSITLPEELITIGSNAFQNCTGLTSITLPEGLTAIGGYAFAGSGLTAIVLPGGLAAVSVAAFRDCAGLGSVTLSEGLTVIERAAFQDCVSLTSVTLPATLTTINGYVNPEGGAFQGCVSLAAIELPPNLASIGSRVFEGCASLTSITLPAAVSALTANMFNACAGLTSLTLLRTDGVVALTASAFTNTPLAVDGGGSIYVPAALLDVYPNANVWRAAANVEIRANLKAIPNS
jgi:hypothetical protein